MSATIPHTLPNGLTVFDHRRYETDFVYREVFVDQIYTRAFPDLPADPRVVDVGANIGLFSLFIKQLFPAARVYAVEPAPVHFALLQKNLAAQPDVHLFQLGLGEIQTRKTLTYYPDYSLLSGFHGNAEEDRRLLSAGIAEQLKRTAEHDASETEKYINLLISNKLENPVHVSCEITTLSALLQQEKIDSVDLLKIDAEKAELDVLKGICENDWSKIHRMVIEAHHTDACHSVCTLLKTRGYQVNYEKTAEFNGTAIYTIYAHR